MRHGIWALVIGVGVVFALIVIGVVVGDAMTTAICGDMSNYTNAPCTMTRLFVTLGIPLLGVLVYFTVFWRDL